MNRALRSLASFAVAALTLAVASHPLVAQTFPGTDAGGQNLRAYHFVFLAYAIAWLLIFAWIVSVARRLARLEKRLEG
jgi:CcmD family protein